ncbi:MAG: restriction endonuclease [Clostridia bacterium]|nr:restriction endonuclease [Clostridia bacterium]
MGDFLLVFAIMTLWILGQVALVIEILRPIIKKALEKRKKNREDINSISKRNKQHSTQADKNNPEHAVQRAKKVFLGLICIGVFVIILGANDIVGEEIGFGASLLVVFSALMYFGATPVTVRQKDEDFNDWSYQQEDDNCVAKDDVSWVDCMDGHEFEYFCAELLQKNGFYDVSVTKGSGDQGVDVLATKGGIKYAIQCKNYFSSLGNTPIQEVNAGKIFYNCHVGVVMTNSYFTQGAIELAKATNVLLWDRDMLQKIMKGIAKI